MIHTRHNNKATKTPTTHILLCNRELIHLRQIRLTLISITNMIRMLSRRTREDMVGLGMGDRRRVRVGMGVGVIEIFEGSYGVKVVRRSNKQSALWSWGGLVCL